MCTTHFALVHPAAAMGCSSSRNVESKKNKILEDAQKALQVGVGRGLKGLGFRV